MTSEAIGTPVAVPKGLWWKSLLVAWVVTRPLGLIALAADVEVPDAVGLPLVAVAWAVTWLVWRRRAIATSAGAHAEPPTLMQLMQRTAGAFAVTALALGYIVVALDTGDLDRTDVPVAPVALALIAVGLLSLLARWLWVPKLRTDHLPEVFGWYRSRLYLRLAWAEVPALVAFGGFLLLGGAGWVYALGLVFSLVGVGLTVPTEGRIRREQERLRATGVEADLVEVLQSRPVNEWTTPATPDR